MSTLPVYNVSVPHLAQIPGGMQHGSMIRIKGTMTHTGDRFTVDLQTGPATNPRSDVNLHLSVRPNENAIVRNSLQNGVWGNEERYGQCPIRVGASFEILLLAQSSAFKVAINGTHFCEFNHRMELTSARFVSLGGALNVQSIVLERDSSGGPGAVPPSVQPYPGGFPSHPPHIHHHRPIMPQPPIGFPGAGHTPFPGAAAYPGVGVAPYHGAGVAPYPGATPYPGPGHAAYPGHGGPPYTPAAGLSYPIGVSHRPITPYNPGYVKMEPIIQPFQSSSTSATPNPPPPPPPLPHFAPIGPNPFDPIQQHQRAFVEAAAAKREKRQKMMQYAAGGVGAGLTALAIGSLIGGIGDSDSD